MFLAFNSGQVMLAVVVSALLITLLERTIWIETSITADVNSANLGQRMEHSCRW